MKWLSILVALWPLAALAQQPQQQTFSITLTAEQLNQVGRALGKLPYEEVQPVVDVIARQIQQQNMQVAQARQKAQDEADDAEADAEDEGESK